MRVEWLMVADSAQVISNKLYTLGGGWESIMVGGAFPVRHKFSVALAILVEWIEANQDWDGQVELAYDDPRQILVTMNGQLRIGRPANLPEGHSQRIQYGMDVDVELAVPGQYLVRARAGESAWCQVGFRVDQGQLQTTVR
ncbi:MAG: DUF6941 family protein [Chloroflexota bacterium]